MLERLIKFAISIITVECVLFIVLNGCLWKKSIKNSINEDILRSKIYGITLDIDLETYNGIVIFTESNIQKIDIASIEVSGIFNKKVNVECIVTVEHGDYCYNFPISMKLRYNKKINQRWELLDEKLGDTIEYYEV